MSAPEPVLDVSGLEVRYGSVPAVRGLDLSVEQGRSLGQSARTAQEVDDAAHDHGRRPTERRRRSPPRCLHPRSRPGENRPRRDRSRSRGKAHLCGANGRGQPPSRALGTSDEIGAAEAVAGVFELFPSSKRLAAVTPGFFPAVSSNSSRSAALWSQSRTSCCSTSPRSGWHRPWWTPSSRRSGRSGSVASRFFSSSSAHSARLRSRIGRVLSNGELRMTLGPEDAGDTRRMVDAYFGSS